jgi:hypothetical protein
MITGAYILITLAAILYLVGWVMLIVTAFRMSIGWGLVVLFLSWLLIPLVIFLVKYWADAKVGFFVMLSGIMAGGLGGFILVGSVATSAMAEFENLELEPFETTQPMVIEDSADTGRPTESGESPSAFDDPQWPTPSPGVDRDSELDEYADEEAQRPPLAGTAGLGNRINWRLLMNRAELSGFVGELIELRLKDGEALRVTLTAIEGDVLKVNQRVGGGSMSYAVPAELIDEIYVGR